MPMGLASSPGWFDHAPSMGGSGAGPFIYYDIVCFSKNGRGHVSHVRIFFERPTTFNLKLAPKKAHLEAKVVIFFRPKGNSRGDRA